MGGGRGLNSETGDVLIEFAKGGGGAGWNKDAAGGPRVVASCDDDAVVIVDITGCSTAWFGYGEGVDGMRWVRERGVTN